MPASSVLPSARRDALSESEAIMESARVWIRLSVGLLAAVAGMAALSVGAALLMGPPLRCQLLEVDFGKAQVASAGVTLLEAELAGQGVVYASLAPVEEGVLLLRGVASANREVARKAAARAGFDLSEAGVSDLRLRLSSGAVEEFGKTLARVLERRLGEAGVDGNVERVGVGRLIVELPSGVDAAALRRVLQVTARLALRPVEQSGSDAAALQRRVGAPGCPACEVLCTEQEARECHLVRREAVVASGDVSTARTGVDAAGQPQVQLKLNPRAANNLREFTRAHVGRRLAIVLDGKLLMAPTIQSEVGDQVAITGRFSREEAEGLARQLRAGALPGEFRTGEPEPALTRRARGLLLALAGTLLLTLVALAGLLASRRSPAVGELAAPAPSGPDTRRPAWFSAAESAAALCLLGPSGGFLGFALAAPALTARAAPAAVVLVGLSACALGLPLLGMLGDRLGRRLLMGLGLALAFAGLLAHGPLLAEWEGVPAWFAFIPVLLTALGVAGVTSPAIAYLTGASTTRALAGTLGGLGAAVHSAGLVGAVAAVVWGAREQQTGLVLAGVGAAGLVAIVGLGLVAALFVLARRVGATVAPQDAGGGGLLSVLLLPVVAALVSVPTGYASRTRAWVDMDLGTLLLLLLGAGVAGLALGGATGDAVELVARREGRRGAGYVALAGAAWATVAAGLGLTAVLEGSVAVLVALLLLAGASGALRGAAWGLLALASPQRGWGAAWGGLQAGWIAGFVGGDLLERLTDGLLEARSARYLVLTSVALAVVPLAICAIRLLGRHEPLDPGLPQTG